MKKWELNHNGNSITVENRAFSERLYINGELQDEQIGWASRARLWGKTPTGDEIKVSLGSVWTTHCRIFVNNKLVLSR